MLGRRKVDVPSSTRGVARSVLVDVLSRILTRCTQFSTQFDMIPSQLSEHTRSHRHAEVKHLCAELVLWWVTTGEASVRDCFALLLHHPCVSFGGNNTAIRQRRNKVGS